MKDNQTKPNSRQFLMWSRKRCTKKKLLVASIIIITIAGLGVGAWWILSNTDLIIKHDKIAEISAESRANLLFEDAVSHRNNGRLDEALDSAMQADNVYQTNFIESFIAEVYTIKGDKEKAISYYRKAISNVDPDEPRASSLAEDYEKTIQFLNGSVQAENYD